MPNIIPHAAPAAAAAAPPSNDSDADPWAEIELNYFNSMRAHREQEDRELEADRRARTDGLRHQLVKNYNAQTELLRQLQVLKGEYEEKQAALDGLDAEVAGVREARRREREREDEERRAWFAKYRRGGLAYRGVEAGGVEERAEEPRKGDEEEVEPAVNGSREEQVGVSPLENGMADDTAKGHGNGDLDSEEPVEEQSTATAAPLVNGQGKQPQVVDEDMADAPNAAQGPEDKMPESESRTDLQNGTPNTDAPQNGPEQEPEVAEEEMPDADVSTSGQEQPKLTELNAADAADAGSALNGQEDKPEVVEGPVPEAEALPSVEGQVQTEAPAAEHDMPDTTPPDDNSTGTEGIEVIGGPKLPQDVSLSSSDDTGMEGVEVIGGPKLPQDVQFSTSDEEQSVEPLGPGGETGIVPPVAEQEAQMTESRQPPAQEAVNSTDNSQPTDTRPADVDVEMEDAETPTQDDTTEAELPDRPEQTAAMPVAPASPSSSSELSSRHTTPELDTPVSLPRELSPSESLEDIALEAIDVIDETGTLVGRVQAPDTSNSLVERIVQRPIKRTVQIRPGRRFSAADLDAVPLPQPGDSRFFKFLSFYVQATGDIQERACLDCSANHGLYRGCVILDDPEFPRCGNCEWNKRRCHYAPAERPSSSRHSLPSKSPTKTRWSAGSFTTVSDEVDEGANGKETNTGGSKKGPPRKSLPTTRKAPAPSTPTTGSFQSDAGKLPEINKSVLCLRHDGVVYTDPPLMRGVPLAKISQDHPYWEADWKPIEELVEPVRQKHQEKYEQLEQAGSTHRDKHLAHRDAKRGRTIFKFLEEGELHPYQLVGKQWINYRITNYDTLFRLAQLLLEELPRMNLDITPAEWLRHRLHEVYLEKGDKFDVASWIGKAYHDRKIEQLREKNGFPRVGRPPAHATKQTPQSSSKKARSLKRKDTHQTPESTPSKAKATGGNRPSSSSAGGTAAAAGATGSAATPATDQQRPKKIKIITSQSQPASAAAGDPVSAKKTKIILNSPFPPSAAVEGETYMTGLSALDYEGYTSRDSISHDRLHSNDWRLHQVKTRTFATNPGVTQYWHWVTEGGEKGDKGDKNKVVIEHQVLESVRPIKWSLFKKPYNFHLKLNDMQEVSFARGTTKVIVAHKKGKDGRDMNPRGDVMAQFKRERTKRRFLTFLGREKGIKVTEVGK